MAASGAAGTTDSEGRFRITRLKPGRYKPSAQANGLTGSAAESFRLGLGETSKEIVIRMHRTATVSARLVRGEGKAEAPCTRGRLVLADLERNRRASASPDRDGFVLLRAVLPGTYTAEVTCHGALAGTDGRRCG